MPLKLLFLLIAFLQAEDLVRCIKQFERVANNKDIGKRVDSKNPGEEYDVYDYKGWGVDGYVIKVPKPNVPGKDIRFERSQRIYKAIKDVEGGIKPLMTVYNEDGTIIQEKFGLSLKEFKEKYPAAWAKMRTAAEVAYNSTRTAAGTALVKYQEVAYDRKAGDFQLAIFDADLTFGHNIAVRPMEDYSQATVADLVLYDW